MSVLIVGAGPAGLATAACLKGEGVPFRLVDRRGVTGGAYREIYPAIVLASPARYVSLPGLAFPATGEYLTAAEYRVYLERYAAHFALTAEPRTLLSLRRAGAGFSVRFADGEDTEFSWVVVATGMHDNPVLPAIEGLPPGLAIHAREWRGPQASMQGASTPGERLLVVGGATSGIEIAEECARAGRRVTLAARSGVKIAPQRFLGRDLHDFARVVERLPRFLFGSLCERRPAFPGTDLGYKRFVAEGLIVERGALARFEGPVAVFADGQRAEVDRVVFATGYGFDMPFLPPEVARARAGHPRARRSESVSWPGLFFVGTPCASGVASEFLRGIADDAPLLAAEIRARLRGRPRAPLVGLVALAILAAHAVEIRREPASLLWCCNVATVLVALGLLLGRARVVAVGFLWLCIGIPCWLVDLASGGELLPTQLLTHLGGFTLGALGLRWFGVPRGTWWRAMAGLVLLQQLCRLVTAPADNVNLAFGVHGSARSLPYPLYYALLLATFSLVFLVMEKIASRLATGRARGAGPRMPWGRTAGP